MATLEVTQYLDRVVLAEVVEDANTVPRYVVAGSSGSVGSGGPKSEDIAQTGEFRRYGNGNTRMITGSARGQAQTLALRALTPSQLDIVKDLLGHVVCYRDTYGRRIFGGFIELNVAPIPLSGTQANGDQLTDVGLVLNTVTYDEAV